MWFVIVNYFGEVLKLKLDDVLPSQRIINCLKFKWLGKMHYPCFPYIVGCASHSKVQVKSMCNCLKFEDIGITLKMIGRLDEK